MNKSCYQSIISELYKLSSHDFHYQLKNGRENKISWQTEVILYEFEEDDQRFCLSVEIIAEGLGVIEDSADIIISTNDDGTPSAKEIRFALQDLMKTCATRVEILMHNN
jgi:hypothetical protein